MISIIYYTITNNIYIYIYIRIYVSMYLCMCVYIFIHTYIHTCISDLERFLPRLCKQTIHKQLSTATNHKHEQIHNTIFDQGSVTDNFQVLSRLLDAGRHVFVQGVDLQTSGSLRIPGANGLSVQIGGISNTVGAVSWQSHGWLFRRAVPGDV